MSAGELLYTRMSGAKNTFFIVDCTTGENLKKLQTMSMQDKRQLARQLCLGFDDNHTDGLIFLVPTNEEADFAWEFFNADGSHADMCGNAARCVTLFAHKKIQAEKKQFTFVTGAGFVHGEVLTNKLIQVEMPTVKKIQAMQVEGVDGFLIHTGVPHFVVEAKPDFLLGQKIRHAQVLLPDGANVTFVENVRRDLPALDAVTYERGVEDMTEACGTGAVAAAAWLQQSLSDARAAISVKMPGGELLVTSAEPGKKPLLVGEAHFEYELKNLRESYAKI